MIREIEERDTKRGVNISTDKLRAFMEFHRGPVEGKPRNLEFQSKGCIYEPCLDIQPNWWNMRSEFGYTKVRCNSKTRLSRKGDRKFHDAVTFV